MFGSATAVRLPCVLAAATYLLLSAAQVSAAADPRSCTSVTNDSSRLACYDSAFGVNTAQTPAGASLAPAASTGGVPTVPQVSRQEPAKSATIESRLVGSLDHWQRGTRFQLENGQIWVCQSERSQSFPTINNPKVVINRNFLGHYFMTVDGVYHQVSVLPAQ